MSLTIAEMREEVKDNLRLEGVATLPSNERVVSKLNEAKNEIVSTLELLDQGHFVRRRDYEVQPNQEYLELPNGDDPDHPPLRRILGLDLVRGAQEIPIPVHDRRHPGEHYSALGYYLYREGDRLYFSGSGAPAAATLRLRYAPVIPDLDGTEAGATYADLPEEWAAAVPLLATASLIPGSMQHALGKYAAMVAAKLAQLRTAYGRTVNIAPLRVRHDDEDAWD